MRLTVVLVVMLAGATMTTGKPLILTKAFLRYVLPTITAKVAGLSGLSGLTGLTGLTGIGRGGGGSGSAKKNGIASVIIPNRLYSAIFPRDSLNPPASVVYHSLDENALLPPPPPVPVPPPSPFPVPHDVTVAQTFTQYGPPPPPPPPPAPVPLEAVYYAQTPSALHEAPLPGHTSSVSSVNTASAPGTNGPRS